jgi:hypothetical protein
MRGRTVLFVVLAVVLALAGVYVGWSTTTPKAVGEPATATPANASVGSTQRRGSGSGPARSPTGSPKGSAEQAASSKDSAANSSAPKQGANHAGTTTPSGNTAAHPPGSKPQHHAGPVRFGQVATTPSDNTVDTAIADDRRALTTTFSAFEVTIDGKSAEPDAIKSFSMTLPLTDGTAGDVVGFHVQGYAFAADGAAARVTLRGGGKVRVRDFPSGADKDVVESLWLPATPGITYQLSAVIEIHKDATGGGDGYLNAAAIDVGIS